MKIALIGSGYWGKNIQRDLYNLNSLDTVCDLNDNVLNTIKQKYPSVNITKDWNSVLSNKEITAVMIALPAELHYKFAREALENNKDVFVEKPLSLNVNEAEELVKIAEEKEKILMVGHVLRYHPCVKKIEEMVKRGEIGKLYYIHCSRKNLGKIRQKENVLWSFAPHDISLILSLCNQSTPINIKCNGGYTETLHEGQCGNNIIPKDAEKISLAVFKKVNICILTEELDFETRFGRVMKIPYLKISTYELTPEGAKDKLNKVLAKYMN